MFAQSIGFGGSVVEICIAVCTLIPEIKTFIVSFHALFRFCLYMWCGMKRNLNEMTARVDFVAFLLEFIADREIQGSVRAPAQSEVLHTVAVR
jgi:hypothetical protein